MAEEERKFSLSEEEAVAEETISELEEEIEQLKKEEESLLEANGGALLTQEVKAELQARRQTLIK